MKKLLVVAAFMAALVPLAASAQTATPPGLIAGDFQLVLPLGDFSNAAGIGIGALGRYERNIIPKLNITGRIGLIYHLGKESSSGFGGSATLKFWTIPILVGGTYDFTDAIFGMAELGLFMNHFSVESGGISGSNSETDVGLTLGGGFRLNPQMEVRAFLQWVDLGHAGDSMALVGCFGYTFWRG